MPRGSASYERELRSLLAGDADALKSYGKTLTPADRTVLAKLERAPFLVVRAAGSLGFDLVALRSEFAFPIEVKASHGETILFSAASGRASQQLEAHRRAVDRVGLLVIYAFRRVGWRDGDPWRLFVPDSTVPLGRLKYLYHHIPRIERTRDGNGALRWEKGQSLVQFLRTVLELTSPPTDLGAE